MAYRCIFTKFPPFPTRAIVSLRQKTSFRKNVRSLFGKYLIFTNTISSGILMGVGDLIQQEIEFRQKILPQRYEWDRVGTNK